MRALVLSGGGSKGAYQAGAILALAAEHKYDMYCGVSVGALNAAYLSQFENPSDGARRLAAIWKKVETKNVRKKWFLWPLSVLWKPSIYNSEPLEQWVRSILVPQNIKHKLSVGATSLTTGEYYSFDEGSKNIVEAVLASASFPGFLKPVSAIGEWWIDGGVRNVTPLAAAIQRGADVIDVVMLDAPGVGRDDADPRALPVLSRTIDIMMDEIVKNDIHMCETYNKHGIKRKIELNVYRPPNDLGINPLDFDPEVSKRLIYEGYLNTYRQLIG